MVVLDWNPDREKLKQFGFISLGGFGLIGTVLGLKLGWFEAGNWLALSIVWGIGVVSAILAAINPGLLKPLYLLLTAISAVIGPVVAYVIMSLIFFLIFFPIGLVFRIMKRDELRLKLDRQAGTYWSGKPPLQDGMRYFRQY